jgi:hypothetical protein
LSKKQVSNTHVGQHALLSTITSFCSVPWCAFGRLGMGYLGLKEQLLKNKTSQNNPKSAV